MSTGDAELSAEFVEWARSVKVSRRAGKALEMLLTHGSVTTGDLSDAGYDHPPRAVRDLKDAGFEIVSRLVNVGGRRMSRYTLIDTMTSDFQTRRPISLPFRKALFEAHDHRCSVCGGVFITRMLQADHRVPFHVGGDPDPATINDFMPLCGSDNRAKSMTCENCPNWTIRDVETCKTCYWHDPEAYEHVATVPERRATLIAREGDVEVLERAAHDAETQGVTLSEHVLNRLR